LEHNICRLRYLVEVRKGRGYKNILSKEDTHLKIYIINEENGDAKYLVEILISIL